MSTSSSNPLQAGKKSLPKGKTPLVERKMPTVSSCYELYLSDETKIECLLAYAYYKRDKSKFISGVLNEIKGANKIEMVDISIDDYVNFRTTNKEIYDYYIEKANKALIVYQVTNANPQTKKLIDDIDKKVAQINDINKPNSTLRRDIGVNLLANLVWVAIITVIGFIASLIIFSDIQLSALKRMQNFIQEEIRIREDVDKKPSE